MTAMAMTAGLGRQGLEAVGAEPPPYGGTVKTVPYSP